ncbi:MAG: FtsX-like permease family protein [Bacteroidales bacterium]
MYDNVDITTIEPKVKQLLKSRHFIAPEDETAVNSFNVQKAFLTFSNLFMGIEILIWIVGMGTLLAGVVGVSNIMLITIRERTKEIGIRRALGASPQVIIRQILSESIALTLISGFLGLFCGLLILVATEQVVKNSARMLDSPVISFNVALMAVFILILAGACAGIIPAINAIRIKAIDALRDE